MNTFSNELTAAEIERLALLAEECGEVIQAVGKILRHGYESTHPDGGATNRELLEEELGDLRHAQDRMTLAKDVNVRAIEEAKQEKAERITAYLHHQQIGRAASPPHEVKK